LKLRKTIHHWFPDLFDKIREIEDCRKKGFYELTELDKRKNFIYCSLQKDTRQRPLAGEGVLVNFL